MKYSAAAFSSVLLLLPAVVSAAAFGAPPQFGKPGQNGFASAQNKGGNAKGQGNNGGNQNNANNNKGNNAAASSAAAATSVAVATSAAAATSVASAAASTASASAVTDDNSDAQDSTTLDPNVIATGFESDGQAVQEAGQVPSLTSSNNFINFCLTVPNLPITNGQQIKTGSCNPAPMGVIAATTNMPSSKFTFPTNGAVIATNQSFTISMAINNLETGNFVNANSNYYSAPQQVNAQGDIIGHTHVTVEALSGFDQTTTTNPNVFAFFKGVNGAAVNGVVTADVTGGLPAGTYRLASINAAANHQPVLVAVAQHGSLDDMVYFEVADGGVSAGNNPFADNSTASATDSGAAAASTDAAASAAAAPPAAASSAAAASAAAPAASSAAAAAGGNQANNNKGPQPIAAAPKPGKASNGKFGIKRLSTH